MLINQSNLDAANRVINAEITRLFSERPPGVHGLFTDVRNATGTSVDHIAGMITVGLREWFGAKQVGNIRAYRQNYVLRKWERTVGVDVDQLNGDLTGAVTESLAETVRSMAYYMEDIVIADLVGNPTGYDGATLLNDSHSNVGTGYTSDNLTTNGLSYSEFKTGIESIEDMGDEAAMALNLSPTLIVTGPESHEIALQVTGQDKVVGIDNTAQIVAPGSTAVDSAAGVIPHALAREKGVSVAISRRIRNSEWFMCDASSGTPYYAYQFEALQSDQKDDRLDDNVFFNNEVIWSVSGKVTPAPGAWQLWYGSVTA